MLISAGAGANASAPVLKSAGEFVVLGGQSVTNTGATTLSGDLGVSPGTSITGLGSIVLTGTVHNADQVAKQAQTDAASAFVSLSGRPVNTSLTGKDLGTLGVLTPGVYSFASDAQLTGDLTLNFQSNPGGAFVFLIGSTLTTASNSDVSVINGGPTSGIYWVVGSSATFGTGTLFVGNVLASQSITFNTGASDLCGRAIALNASVTLDTNSLSNNCAGTGNLGSGRSDFGSQGFAGGTAVPEPAGWALMLAGIGAAGATVRRKRILSGRSMPA
jgi:hypothetical protein